MHLDGCHKNDSNVYNTCFKKVCKLKKKWAKMNAVNNTVDFPLFSMFRFWVMPLLP